MKRTGFTIIELLIVMVVVSLLAAITLPKLSGAKGKAQVAAMKTDLRNLVTIEENALAESGRYTTRPRNYSVSSGNNRPAITLTRDGWTASLTNAAGTQQCAVYIGSTPLSPATAEGVPACTETRTATSPIP
jgi:prepilin-type N-terminal cleavage/methylation domain-containing protein